MEDLWEWLREELRQRDIELTEEIVRKLLCKIEEEKEWTAVAPELYKNLREKAVETISTSISIASKELDSLCEHIKAKIKFLQVGRGSSTDLEAIAADASSYLMPLVMSNVALIAGVAVRISPSGALKYSVKCDVINEQASMNPTHFRFLMSAMRESLVMRGALHQLSKKLSDIVVLDGPLSISEWYKEAYSNPKVQSAVDNELIRSENELLKLCKAKRLKLIAISKRMRSRYFHNYFDLSDEYTDQFLFHLTLPYGYRTESISITKAIKKWKEQEAGFKGAKRLLINKLSDEIYGFYIKTSDNPLTPPIRVEFPSYLRGYEDELASYVLSTSVVSNDQGYDGLPKVQCIAHHEAKITKRAMEEIFKELLARIGNSPDRVRLLAVIRGIRLE